MSDPALTTHYIEALRGDDWENAFHRLIELGEDGLDLVGTAFRTELSIDQRRLLLRVLWQTRSDRARRYLEEALNDSKSSIWKEALDGLTALGGLPALDALRDARERANAEKAEWLDEAIEQITEAMNDARDTDR
jgi:hypothetical protein